MKRSSPTRSTSKPLAAVLFSTALFFGASVRAQKPAKDRPAEWEILRDRLVKRIMRSPTSAARGLRIYNGIERSEKYTPKARYGLHTALVNALREIDAASLKSTVWRVLRSSTRSQLPMRIVAMKALVGPKFPASRQERVEKLVDAAGRESFREALWGFRLLGDSRWSESVDALIALLRSEETAEEPDELCKSIASAELFRLLGNAAPQGATAEEIEHAWASSGKEVPKTPDYSRLVGGRTISFFGDLISPRAVFVIDISSSMKQETFLKALAKKGKTAVKKKDGASKRTGEKKPKVEIVKRELERSLTMLRPIHTFNIVSYDRALHPWRHSSALSLHRADRDTLRSAIDFTRKLEPGSGTNIHDSLVAAIGVSDVETVYLLSDGEPSVGGTKEEIERKLAEVNYLLGVRVITYGFAADDTVSYDEEFMKRLARDGRGWYRRLN